MTGYWFFTKKAISWFIFPLGQALILWVVGLLLWWRRPQRRIGPVLLIAGSLLLLLYSTPVVSGLLLQGLESQNPHYARVSQLRSQGIKYIVVLGGGTRGGTMSPVDRLNEASLKRFLEGLRLWSKMPGSTLVVAGSDLAYLKSRAKDMEIFSRQIQSSKGTLIFETASLDTDDQAKILSGLLGKAKIALVTSAHHMPRSLSLFRAYGMDPVPAPVDFRAKGMTIDLASFVPKPRFLVDSQKAIKEYMGWLWEELKRLYATVIPGEEKRG